MTYDAPSGGGVDAGLRWRGGLQGVPAVLGVADGVVGAVHGLARWCIPHGAGGPTTASSSARPGGVRARGPARRRDRDLPGTGNLPDRLRDPHPAPGLQTFCIPFLRSVQGVLSGRRACGEAGPEPSGRFVGVEDPACLSPRTSHPLPAVVFAIREGLPYMKGVSWPGVEGSRTAGTRQRGNQTAGSPSSTAFAIQVRGCAEPGRSLPLSRLRRARRDRPWRRPASRQHSHPCSLFGSRRSRPSAGSRRSRPSAGCGQAFG
jgi:hypothetical protein